MNNVDKTRPFQIIINSTADTNSIGNVHWDKLGVTRHIKIKMYFNLIS